jgi:phosphoglycolate phosphatase-like HAD superfamily hydrolase
MKASAVLFDLDDTLIDTRKRHFEIVKDFVGRYSKELNFDDYIMMRKTNNWSNSQVIQQKFGLNKDEFTLFWKRNIECRQYLEHDNEIVSYTLLENLKATGLYDFILLSLRSNPQSAEQQFQKFAFSKLFNEYAFLQHADVNPKILKLKYYKSLYRHLVFISDSQDDCHAATLSGVDFVGVQSGIYHLSCHTNFDDVNSFLKTL